jgi:hypothetical protein
MHQRSKWKMESDAAVGSRKEYDMKDAESKRESVVCRSIHTLHGASAPSAPTLQS